MFNKDERHNNGTLTGAGFSAVLLTLIQLFSHVFNVYEFNFFKENFGGLTNFLFLNDGGGFDAITLHRNVSG